MKIKLVVFELLKNLFMYQSAIRVVTTLSVEDDLSHGVVLFKGMVELALASVSISFFGKV